MISIESYLPKHQQGIDLMMLDIAAEFKLPISSELHSTPIALENYWVALKGEEVLGTVGHFQIDATSTILKNMFVKQSYRGKEFGVSKLLLKKVTDLCIAQEIQYIYLGSMNQFKAAQRFYEKNGFKQIDEGELPKNFLNNPIDDVYYSKSIV